MTELELFTLSRWESIADLGEWLVIVGVAGEGIEIAIKVLEHKSKNNKFLAWCERHDFAIEIWGAFFWFLVVIGLWMELKGNHVVSLISAKENTRLTVEAADTSKLAAVLNDRASSNEVRVSELNVEASLLESNNLVLRSNVVALEMALQWRTISPKQEAFITNFFSTQKQFFDEQQRVGTNRVEVRSERTDAEACWYARRIVEVLKKCGVNAFIQMQVTFANGETPPFVGLGFVARDFSRIKSGTNDLVTMRGAAGMVVVGLHLIGIDADSVERDPRLEEGDLIIVVGHKPEK